MNTHASDMAKLVLERLEVRKTKCYTDKNPYYDKPQDEWIDLTIKIKELKAKIK